MLKYYEHDCLQNFLLLFMSLLTALIVENSQILAEIYFIFLNMLKVLNTKFRPHRKDRVTSFQIRQILVLFSKLVALILD